MVIKTGLFALLLNTISIVDSIAQNIPLDYEAENIDIIKIPKN
jgi:hypothetical protein